jgi:hypothetical protein
MLVDGLQPDGAGHCRWQHADTASIDLLRFVCADAERPDSAQFEGTP